MSHDTTASTRPSCKAQLKVDAGQNVNATAGSTTLRSGRRSQCDGSYWQPQSTDKPGDGASALICLPDDYDNIVKGISKLQSLTFKCRYTFVSFVTRSFVNPHIYLHKPHRTEAESSSYFIFSLLWETFAGIIFPITRHLLCFQCRPTANSELAKWFA